MSERRSQRSIVVSPPRAGDAVGAALRSIYRSAENCASEWDMFVKRIDRADSDRRR